jgi:hypothetical protein
MLRKKTIIVLLAGLALLLCAVPSFADDAERAVYREQVEPICKKNTEANEKILKGVRKEVKQGELKKASRQFLAAAKALKKTRLQLLKVAQPPEDEARLTKWLGLVKTEAELFERAGHKLAAGEKAAAQRMVVRLTSNANKANNLVIGFEFHYCRFEPSKFI